MDIRYFKTNKSTTATMKKPIIIYLVFIVIILSNLKSFGQPYYNAHNYGNEFSRVLIDSTLSFSPLDTNNRYTNINKPELRVALNNNIYFWNTSYWDRVATYSNVIINGGQNGSQSGITIGPLNKVPLNYIFGYTNPYRITIDTGSGFNTYSKTNHIRRDSIEGTFYNWRVLNASTGWNNIYGASSAFLLFTLDLRPRFGGANASCGGYSFLYCGDSTSTSRNTVYMLKRGVDNGNDLGNGNLITYSIYPNFQLMNSPLVMAPPLTSGQPFMGNSLAYKGTNGWFSPSLVYLYNKLSGVANGGGWFGATKKLLFLYNDASGTGDYIYATHDSLNYDYKVDRKGNSYIKSLRLKGYRTVSSNTTLNDSDAVIFVNTTIGDITVTCNQSNDSDGKVFTVIKISSDTNKLILSAAGGATINGGSSYTISGTSYPSASVYQASGNFYTFGSANNSNSGASNNLILASQFSAKADLQRVILTSKASTDTITAAASTFSSTDTGKVICIHKVRNISSYTTSDSGAVTARIKTYISPTVVRIDSTCSYTFTDSFAYWGTENYDLIQSGIDFCNSSGTGQFILDKQGTYGIFPKLSRRSAPPVGYIGFNLNAPVNITGCGKGITNLKWSVEDDIHITESENYLFNGFCIMDTGSYSITNLTMLSPDRYNLQVVNAFGASAVKVNGNIILPGSFSLSNVDILGDSAAKKYNSDWDLQWAQAYTNTSLADSTSYYMSTIKDVNSSVSFIGLHVYAGNGHSKGVKTENVTMYGSGSYKVDQTFSNCASVSSSSTALTVSGIRGFSWYSFTNSTAEYDRAYLVTISDGVHTFSDTMGTITSPNVLQLRHASSFTFTNATITVVTPQNMVCDGHQMYIHDNIDLDLRNTVSIDCKGLDLQHFGNSFGTADYSYFTRCSSKTGKRNITSNGWLLGHSGNTDFQVRDCNNFTNYSLGQAISFTAWNTDFGQQVNLYNSCKLYNCKSVYLRAYSNSQVDTVDGGIYDHVDMLSGASGTVALINAAAINISNNSSGGGVINALNSYVANVPSGSATTNISLRLGGTNIYTGSGSPESVVTANVGSLYLRSNGSTSTSLYVKETGSGNTGWVAK